MLASAKKNMRSIVTITILFISLFSCGQAKKTSTLSKLNLNKDSISQIKISNYCGPMDSCQTITYKLNRSIMEVLVDKLNTSDRIGPCEFTNLYWLHIYFTDSTIRTYITNGSLFAKVKKDDDYPFYTTIIKTGDLCLKIKDSDYIKNVWAKLGNKKNKIDIR